jgi:renalase
MSKHTLQTDIAVIGAGFTGARIAGALAAAGQAVMVLDKARGAGGRLSLRRTEFGSFAHGCPPAAVAACRAAIAPADGERETLDAYTTSLPKRLLGCAQARFGAQVAAAERVGGQWLLRDAQGAPLASASRLLLTAPAAQSAALLEPVKPGWAQSLGALRCRPAWSLLLALPADTAPPDWNAAGELLAEVQAQPSASRDEVAPEPHRRWVLRLTDAASLQWLEAAPEAVLAMLSARLGRAVDSWSYAAAHRWRYARVIEPLPQPLYLDQTLQLAVCGDAFAGAEAATDLERAQASARALLQAWG